MVDPSGNEEIFLSIFLSIGHLSALKDIIQPGLNLVVEIIEGFALLCATWNVVTKVLAGGTLAMVVWEVGVDWYRLSNILFLWSVLGSGCDCCSCAVTWSGLCCWCCRRYGIPWCVGSDADLPCFHCFDNWKRCGG